MREGIKVGQKRVAALMQKHALRAKAARRYKATTNSRHKLPVSENLLKQDFSAKQVGTKLVSDITYIWTEEDWLYLAVVLDLLSRKVVGYAIDRRMTAQLVIEALQSALDRCVLKPKAIVHSDRGSQYCAKDYQSLLQKHDLVSSMSKKGDCYDNAAMESWNHSLKVERIHGEKFATRAQAKAAIFEYIEVYYNRVRMHSALGYLSPVEFEKQTLS